MFERAELPKIAARLAEPRRFTEVIMGPRQVGKTTRVRQVLKQLTMPATYVSADGVGAVNAVWIEQQWESARF